MSFWSKKEKKSSNFNVLVAICAYSGIDSDAFESLLQLQLCPNPRMVIKKKTGDALIDRSRSIMATAFLKSKDFDCMLFLDHDIVFNPVDAVKICRLAYEQDLGIVGGPYVKKQMEGTHFAVKTFDGEEYTFGSKGACQEVDHVSTGFMAITKKVFQTVVDTFPEEEMPYCQHSGLDFYPFFQPYPKKIDGTWRYLSEDWAWCDRAKKAGFKIYCDTTTELKHMGRYAYENGDILRPAKPRPENLSYTDNNGQLAVKVV